MKAFIARWAWAVAFLGWLLLILVYSKVGLVVFADSEWVATAYCKGSTVAAGMPVRRGMAASDPKHIPLGSVIKVSETGDPKWDGIYWVVDTGPEIQGREIDLYSWSCYEALDFGRRKAKVEIVRNGWMPNQLVTK